MTTSDAGADGGRTRGSASPSSNETIAHWSGFGARANARDPVARALDSVRSQLGMDVAFIAEFHEETRTVRHVSASRPDAPIAVGMRVPLDEGYCKKIVDGVLPALIVDASQHAEARAIPVTAALPIGSHIAAPLNLSDGSLYGTLCCFSFKAQPRLGQRELLLLNAFAAVVACQLEVPAMAARAVAEQVRRVSDAIWRRSPDIVYQPIFKIFDMSMTGAEALARFPIEPIRPPDVWFLEASAAGLRVPLERQAIRNAVTRFRDVWKTAPVDLNINSSPQTILEGDIAALLRGAPANRIILEITEHDHVDDYPPLLAKIAELRRKGVRIAVDDAGSGYASMRHILNVAPDYIKLDISLTRAIDSDRMRRALASSLIEFARQTNCQIVAEGVETAAEFLTLRNLGVDKAQGFFLSRPTTAANVIDFATGAVKPAAERVAWEEIEQLPSHYEAIA